MHFLPIQKHPTDSDPICNQKPALRWRIYPWIIKPWAQWSLPLLKLHNQKKLTGGWWRWTPLTLKLITLLHMDLQERDRWKLGWGLPLMWSHGKYVDLSLICLFFWLVCLYACVVLFMHFALDFVFSCLLFYLFIYFYIYSCIYVFIVICICLFLYSCTYNNIYIDKYVYICIACFFCLSILIWFVWLFCYCCVCLFAGCLIVYVWLMYVVYLSIYLCHIHSCIYLFVHLFTVCMCVCVLFSCKPNHLQVDLFHDWLIESWINRSMYGVFACI